MAALPQNFSAFSVYQRNKEENEKLTEKESEQERLVQNGLDGVNSIRVSVQDKENMAGAGKTRTRFKNFSIKLHDLAYSPVLKHKIGLKRKLLHQKNNRGIKKKRRLNGTSDKKTSTTSENVVQTDFAELSEEERQSSGILEQCWKSRTPFMEAFDIDQYPDSREAASMLLKWLIYPVQSDKFVRELWERKPLLLKRHRPYYNDGLFSCAEFDRILRENCLEFSMNIDITKYQNGKKETYNPEGRAHASTVWDFYQKGYSVRLLNPQTFSQSMWKLNSTLQEYFGSCVGANVYLTPPGSQGFAPHYDDIEAFVLQLEGKKNWKLYFPRNDKEILPRFSSGNFHQEEISDPILDITLEAGDMLYFPRGTIHQAQSLPDTHSLHVTISAAQRNSWGDLLEKLVPMALSIAVEQDKEFRESLPLDYMNYMGTVHSTDNETKRSQFGKKLASLMNKLLGYIPVDEVADQMAAKYMHDCLPPCLTEKEKMCGIWGSGARWDQNLNKSVGSKKFKLSTQIKLLRHGIARVITEPDAGFGVYYTTENSRIYHEKEPLCLDLDEEAIPAMDQLMSSYPDYIEVRDLPLEEDQSKIEFATVLYSKGIIISRDIN
ncbi:ribosomal oxygenase 1-like [Dysidea avara]|uniref:ribosomal oxygenase 1-like n=1 Tax=Dysidea avara TaxID=196820 RepID=UPI003316A5A6